MMRQKRILLIALPILAGLSILTAWKATPDALKVQSLAMGSDRVLLSSDGSLIQTLRTDFNKRRLPWLPLNNFPQSLRDAVIQTEDHRFYSHFGIDPLGLARAAYAILRHQPVQGASTLTMQLSDLIQPDVLTKNKHITKGSLVHKFVQVARALLIESKWKKDEILEGYLNLIHLRGEYQGVQALSYAYLGRHPLTLDAAESQVIATMISSPGQSKGVLKARACRLASRHHLNMSCSSTDLAVDEFFKHTPVMPMGPNFAPHLARRLFHENPTDTIIKSTLDANIQRKVSEVLEKNLYHLRDSNVHDSAAIVIENGTGRVLAYVGAVAGSESPHVDGVQAYRQAGSSLKPFLYTKALDSKTLTPASILLDEPTALSWSGGVYRPSNYDKHFSGPVSVREALGSSLNVPAVKAVTIIGLHEAYHVLEQVGLTGLKEPDFYGVSMALGAVEVRLEDLANAYRILSNGGLKTPLRYRESDQAPKFSERVFSNEATYLTRSILSDPSARSIGFGWDNPLETPVWTAVKTGTSKDYRDNWCVGFSERYTVAVWTGNFNAEAMEKVSGVSGAGPSWFDIMAYLHRQLPSNPPPIPANVIAKKIRHQWEGRARTEYFIKGTEPQRETVETANNKRPEFVFPAEGSVLVKDPQMDQNNVALFVRFSGQVPEKSQLLWDGKLLGEAISPFKLDQPKAGDHRLSIITPEGKVVSAVSFKIKGI